VDIEKAITVVIEADSPEGATAEELFIEIKQVMEKIQHAMARHYSIGIEKIASGEFVSTQELEEPLMRAVSALLLFAKVVSARYHEDIVTLRSQLSRINVQYRKISRPGYEAKD
jgi:hypothetical protein